MAESDVRPRRGLIVKVWNCRSVERVGCCQVDSTRIGHDESAEGQTLHFTLYRFYRSTHRCITDTNPVTYF